MQEQEGQIRDVLETDESADTEFWETVLKRLQVAFGFGVQGLGYRIRVQDLGLRVYGIVFRCLGSRE